MIKTLTIIYLLGATCFSSASPTVGQSQPGRQQLVENKNHLTQTTQWPMTQVQNGNPQVNGQLSRSPESENEINDNENTGAGGDGSAAAAEDKQNPVPPTPQQQPQPSTSPAPQYVNPNQRPLTNQQQVYPIIPYAAVHPNGNHPPGMPITQYSGVQMTGYHKEQTGQAPISHQQQMLYTGGSNSIPMVIYSDSERPPITMFYLGQGDKQMQGALKNGELIPNLQPMGQQQLFYSQSSSPLPMAFYDQVTQSQVSPWDRQYPMFETYSSPQFYPFNSNIIMKTKTSNKEDRIITHKSLKPKADEYSAMSFENELSSEPMGWTAFMTAMPRIMNVPNRNIFNPRANDETQDVESMMIPDRQKLIKSESMRNVVSPFWGKQAMLYDLDEPMERSSSNNWDATLLGSKYSLPTSPYTSSGYSSSSPSSSSYSPSSEHGSSGYSSSSSGGSPYSSYGGQHSSSAHSSGSPSGSSYSTSGGQHSSLNQGGHSLSHSNTGAQNQYSQDKYTTGYIQHNGGYSQSQTGYSGPSHGHSGLTDSNTKYQNHYGSGHESTGHLNSGSSYGSGSKYGNSGSNYGHSGSGHRHSGSGSRQSGSGKINKVLLRAANPQQSSLHQNIPSSQGAVYSDSPRGDKNIPIVAIVPIMLPSDFEQSGSYSLNKNQLESSSAQSHLQAGSHSSGRTAVLGTGYLPSGIGLGGGYGNTGLNNQYSNFHNGQLAGQNSGASNNQQFGHENVATGFIQPLPTGGQIYTQVNSDKGFSGGSYGQGSQSLGINDQNFNAGGLNSNQGYNSGLGVGGLNTAGVLPGSLGYGGVGLGLNNGYGNVQYG